MTLKNNRAPLLSTIELYASFHRNMCIQTGVTVRKRLNGVMTSVTLNFDLDLLHGHHFWSLVIPENFMMIRWWEHSQKGVTDGQTNWTIYRAAWSQLKIGDWYKYWNSAKPGTYIMCPHKVSYHTKLEGSSCKNRLPECQNAKVT